MTDRPVCSIIMLMARTSSNVRTRLIDTAAKLFYRQGYLATGINQVIDEAKVAKASFYHHFKTKEDLLVAWLERMHEVAMGRLRAFASDGKTPAERIRRLFLGLKERFDCGEMASG